MSAILSSDHIFCKYYYWTTQSIPGKYNPKRGQQNNLVFNGNSAQNIWPPTWQIVFFFFWQKNFPWSGFGLVHRQLTNIIQGLELALNIFIRCAALDVILSSPDQGYFSALWLNNKRQRRAGLWPCFNVNRYKEISEGSTCGPLGRYLHHRLVRFSCCSGSPGDNDD